MPCGRLSDGPTDARWRDLSSASPRATRGATEQTMRNLILVLLGASLPLFGGCTGGPGGNGDDTGTNPDDTGSGWAATIRITLPSDTPDGAEVWVDGDAVPSCDAESKECVWTATEAGDYEIDVECDGLYFATQFVEVETNGQTADLTWQKGGCTDPEWSVGDGQCADEDGNSLWVDGQYGCDLTGFWKAIEDDFQDFRGDVEMTSVDEDGDGVYEAAFEVVDGDGFLATSSPVNMSGTGFYHEDGGLTINGVMSRVLDGDYVEGDCSDKIFRVVSSGGAGYEIHMELYEE